MLTTRRRPGRPRYAPRRGEGYATLRGLGRPASRLRARPEGWNRDPGRRPADAAPGRQRRRGLGGAADRLGPGRRGLAGLARRPDRRSPGRPAHALVQRTMGHQPGPLADQPGMARHAHHPGRADRHRAGVRGRHGRRRGVADHRRAHPAAGRPGRRARRQPADHAADAGPGREDRHQAPPVAGRGQSRGRCRPPIPGCCSATSSGHPAAARPCSRPGKTPSPRSWRPARARRPR